MIPKNVTHQALVRGHTVRFATASDILSDLAAQESAVALTHRTRRYVLPHLLCVDEVSYLSHDSRYADLLFEVVTRRYDAHRSIVLSTNKAFTEWNQVFPHATCTVTLVDRPIHRAKQSPKDPTGQTEWRGDRQGEPEARQTDPSMDASNGDRERSRRRRPWTNR